MTTLGHRLRAARIERRMTQQQLAIELGVTNQVISDIERGVKLLVATKMKPLFPKQYAEALGLDVEAVEP